MRLSTEGQLLPPSYEVNPVIEIEKDIKQVEDLGREHIFTAEGEAAVKAILERLNARKLFFILARNHRINEAWKAYGAIWGRPSGVADLPTSI